MKNLLAGFILGTLVAVGNTYWSAEDSDCLDSSGTYTCGIMMGPMTTDKIANGAITTPPTTTTELYIGEGSPYADNLAHIEPDIGLRECMLFAISNPCGDEAITPAPITTEWTGRLFVSPQPPKDWDGTSSGTIYTTYETGLRSDGTIVWRKR